MNSVTQLSEQTGEPPVSGGRGKVHLWTVVTLLVIQVVMYELFPHFTQWVEFDWILRNGIYWGPLVALAVVAFKYAVRSGIVRRLLDKEDLELGTHRRAFAVGFTLLSFAIIWSEFAPAGRDLVAYHLYASMFTAREGLIPSTPDFVRFTPLQNAANDIGNSVSSTGEQVESAYVQPMLTGHGFAYVAPITPSGMYNTFVNKNPGFILLDDSSTIDDPHARLQRIDDEQQIGQGMELFDNLYYVLAKTDFFADFDTPHFLALDAAQPHKLTLIVPKVKYAFFWQLPYWGGDVLVHADGTVEDLSAEQAQADPRLKGKWIYPISLARRYVELQNYAAGHGLLTPFVRLAGLFEIEQLDGVNQFPFLTHGNDDKPYLVSATKGQGAAKGLFRMYYVDASTGAGSYHQFGTNDTHYGAGASLQRVTNIQIPGVTWFYRSGEHSGGVHVAIEPVYIARPGDPDLYWKFTVTNVQYSGIFATVVLLASNPDKSILFLKRDDFERWLRGGPAPTASSHKDAFRLAIESVLQQLQGLQKQVEQLP